MLVTVQNDSGGVINDLDVYPGTTASGGLRKNALPYPFGWIGELANAANKQLTMHPGDLYYRSVLNGSAQMAWEKFQQMIQAGTISVTIADQGSADGVRAFDELFFIEV
jgi:hypothetical protein